MDEVDEIINKLKNDPVIKKAYFSSKFLNEVGDLFERRGFGATRVYLLDKQERRNKRDPATALLQVLEKFAKCPRIEKDRRIGRQIIKTLVQLRRTDDKS